MEMASGPRVTVVERFTKGVLITFDDGRCAMFPDELLYATLPEAQAVDVSDDESS